MTAKPTLGEEITRKLQEADVAVSFHQPQLSDQAAIDDSGE